MAHREFTDGEGVHWQAWEVIPSTAERRSAGERRFGSRERTDRRVKAQLRVRMDERIARGWLVFESAEEKRRLSPIPAGWSELTDAQLAELARTAGLAGRTAPG